MNQSNGGGVPVKGAARRTGSMESQLSNALRLDSSEVACQTKCTVLIFQPSTGFRGEGGRGKETGVPSRKSRS